MNYDFKNIVGENISRAILNSFTVLYFIPLAKIIVSTFYFVKISKCDDTPKGFQLYVSGLNLGDGVGEMTYS